MRRLKSLLLSAALIASAASAKPTTEQADPSAPAQSEEAAVAQLRAAVAAMREEIFRPGPPIAGWNLGGADPDSELAAAGPDRHYFLLRAEGEPPSVVIMSERRLADFVPAEWRLVDSYGSALDAVDRPFLQYSWLSPRYAIAVRADGFRRDNIDCSDRVGHAQLYEVPGATMTEEDEAAPMLFRFILLASEGITTCTRYEGSRASGWSTRPLLPDGRSLPAFEEPPERMTIVPAAPLAELMRR